MTVQEFGLGPQLNTSAMPDNPWPAVLEMDARQLISMFSRDRHIPFAMTESFDIQALASFDPPLILVSGGLADAICRFCARLVTAGVFIAFGEASPNWQPSPDRFLESVQKLIRDEPFRWSSAYVPWKDDAERQQLFAFLAISIHRFVVLHELGHIVFRHGERGSGAAYPVVDGDTRELTERSEIISSQARELAADGYAMNSLLRLFEAEFERPDLDPMRALIKSKLMGDRRERLRMVLFAAFAVFQILDRRNWTLDAAMKASHPSAPARVKATYAAALELRIEGLSEQDLAEDVMLAHSLSHAIVSVGFDTYPDFDWLGRLDDPDFNAFMLEVVEELPRHTWKQG